MNATPPSPRPKSAFRWLAILLAGLVFGMGIVSVAHAVDLDKHAAGEVCEICAIPSGDGGALPVASEHSETGFRCLFVAAAARYQQASRADGSAQPRAPPA